MKPSVLAGLAAGVAIPAYGVYRRYRRDMNAARARLAAVDRRIVSTRWGAVEYAERGSGAPVLVIHGIFHNCVGGLLSVRDLVLDREGQGSTGDGQRRRHPHDPRPNDR